MIERQDHPESTLSFLYMNDYSTWSLEAEMFLHGFPAFGSGRQGWVTNPNQEYVSRIDTSPLDKVMSSISSMLSSLRQEQGELQMTQVYRVGPPQIHVLNE